MIGEDAPIPDTVKVTDLERRLARRIHNQRRQLRQWEQWKNWQGLGPKLRRVYCESLMQRNKECRDLKAELEAIKIGRGFWHRLLDHMNIK